MINFDVIRVLKEFYGKNEVKKSTKDHLNVLQHTILNEQATKNLYVSLMPYPSAWKKYCCPGQNQNCPRSKNS